MKQNLLLTITCVLTILLVTLHLADDVVRGFAQGGIGILIAVPILVFWLYGALVLAERRAGCVIMLLGSLLGFYISVLHLTGKGVSAEIAQSSGGFFFIWTIIALGVTALLSVFLSVRGLWRLLRTTPR